MLLEQIAHFNDLSPKLREELTAKIKSFGKTVRYKFNISNPNPDPTKHNGAVIWPRIYTLDPTVFSITDPYEERTGKQKYKQIALVDGTDEQGRPNKFRKIRIEERWAGVLTLQLEDNPEHFYYAMFLELHPKLTGGKFLDKTKQQVFIRIDEKSLAHGERQKRSARKTAMDLADKMSDADVKEFADAMAWDSTEEMELLRNKVEELAEQTPEMFNDLVKNKKMKYQAAVKRAVDKNIWSHNPAEGKLSWASTGQPIVMLGASMDGKSDYERFGEWFLTAGANADKAYNKLLSLEKESVTS